MPHITSIKIGAFRNLTAINLNPTSQFNFFFGQNGAGKTSLLEAIYYLSVGRSFRTHLPQRLIQNTSNSFSIFLTIKENNLLIPLGVERYQQGNRHLKANGENVSNWSILAKKLPLCLLSAMSHRFLLDGPKIRRQFLDWLLFHVEPSFFPAWQRVQRILKQRNAALKTQLPRNEVIHWDELLNNDAEFIHKLRQGMVSKFIDLFEKILKQLLPEHSITVYYDRGWNENTSLKKILANQLNQDLQRGYTQAGPQRADLRLLIKNLPVQDILSQGQQKLVTYALHLTQGLLYKEKTSYSPIYLIDDLTAELDSAKQKCVIDLLTQLESQVFITLIDPHTILVPSEASMFHVEQGSVYPASLAC